MIHWMPFSGPPSYQRSFYLQVKTFATGTQDPVQNTVDVSNMGICLDASATKDTLKTSGTNVKVWWLW